MTKRIISLLIALLLALSCFGCIGAMAEEAVPTLTTTHGIPTTDAKCPWLDWSFATNLEFRTLLAADAAMNVVGTDLAESYEVSDDGLTITIVLKDGIKWDDGEALTMDDVIFSFDAAQQTEITATYVAAFNYMESYTAEGNTLTIKLNAPFVDFLPTLAQFAIIPQHCFTECDPAEISQWAPFWEFNPVGCGPMKQTSIVEDEYFILEPNPYYEGEAPKIPRIVVKTTSDVCVEAQAGTLDYFADMSADTYNVVSNLDFYKVINADWLYFRQIIFNVAGVDGNVNEYMQNPLVRRAITYAVDWGSLMESLFGDRAGTTTTGVLASDPKYIGAQYTYDPEMAKQLLEEGGYDFDHEFNVLYYYTDQATIDMMDAIVYYLGEVGMKAKATLAADAAADIYETRDYDMVYCGLACFTNLNWYTEYIDKDWMGKLMAPAIDDFSDLISKLSVCYDDEETVELYKELQAFEAEKCYKFPACTLKYQFYVSNRLQIPETVEFGNVTYHYDFDFANWEIVDA